MASAKLIGERVERKRAASSLSKRALGLRAGISKSTVSRIERGECEPQMETLTALATALGTTYHDLVRPPGPRLRVAKIRVAAEPVAAPKEEPFEIPMIVTELLCTGRLGRVKRSELRQLIRNSRDPEFAGDKGLLELDLLFRRACRSMHDTEAKQKFDRAFERIRQDLLRE